MPSAYHGSPDYVILSVTMNEASITKAAIDWVKSNRKALFMGAVERSRYDTSVKEENPAATFMAGTPGAGKTEVSTRFAEQFSVRPVRVDADEFRGVIPGYTGHNSHVIQPAAALAVDKVMDIIYKKRYSFILDGTFAYGHVVVNLKRAQRKGYNLQVIFVYQDPVQAWRFTKVREQKEGRNVPIDAFIDSYFKARENVKNAKKEFGGSLDLTLIIKDYITNSEVIHSDIDNIDKYLDKVYNRDELKGLLA